MILFKKTYFLGDEVEIKLTILLYQIIGDVREFSKHDKGKKYFREKTNMLEIKENEFI